MTDAIPRHHAVGIGVVVSGLISGVVLFPPNELAAYASVGVSMLVVMALIFDFEVTADE